MARPTNAAARGEPAGTGGAPAPDPVVAGGVAIGSGTFTLIARSPAAVDAERLLEAAALARQARAGLLDVGRAWDRLGADAVDACQRASGLGAICAVREPGDVAAAARLAAMLRVEAAALEGSLLPRALGTAGLPVLLERGPGATVQDWLRAAERIGQEGNPEVVLCDPGDDLAALPSLRAAGARPLVVDASRAERADGNAAALARAAAAVGADGVSIPVDGGLDGLSSELAAVAGAVGRRMAGRRIRYVGGRDVNGGVRGTPSGVLGASNARAGGSGRLPEPSERWRRP
jgi:3-deoxy-D-arabino-heptulosonate 7-phosphate (DAHP) synthase